MKETGWNAPARGSMANSGVDSIPGQINGPSYLDACRLSVQAIGRRRRIR